MRLPYGTVSAEEQAHLIALCLEAEGMVGTIPDLLPADPMWVALDVLRTHEGWVPMWEWAAQTARVLWLGLGGSIPWGLAHRESVYACGSRIFRLRHEVYEAHRPQRPSVVIDTGMGRDRMMAARKFTAVHHPPLSGTRWAWDPDTDPRQPPLRLTYPPLPEAPAAPAQLSLLEAA